MSNRSYLLKLIIPFAILIVAVVMLSGWLIYRSGQEVSRKQQLELLSGDARAVALKLGHERNVLSPLLMKQIEEESRARNVRITIIDAFGVVRFDSHAHPEEMENHNDREEIIAARRTGSGQSVRPSRSMHTPYLYAAQRVDGADGLVVRASEPERAVVQVSTAIVLQLATAVTAAIVILSLLTFTLHRRWIAPVRRLATAAEQMAAGQWKTRVDVGGGAELRDFSSRLNHVAEQAQKHVEDLRLQRADLASLVDSLPDPILLTDAQHRIVLLNEPAAKFLQITPRQALGAKLISILGESSLVDIYEHVMSDDVAIATPYVRELRVTRKGQKLTYQAVATRTQAGALLLVLRDVTQLAAAVQMKTDFVANASHELRTPIAAIKIAFETLSDVYKDDPSQTERCMTIIDGHLRRLEDMLQDLLDLSRVENAEIKPELASLKASEVLCITSSTMGPLARNKGLELVVDADESLTFTSDRRLLGLILKNLVENSIKYTPAGGTVTVRMWRDVPADGAASAGRSQILLSVADTGIGIPPQHLERVFERFYQVDAARSGSAGRGTGLGLAIVKHAVHALGGQVQLQSTVGRGTTVTCAFPEGAALVREFASTPTPVGSDPGPQGWA